MLASKKKTKSEIQSDVVTITPEIATNYLNKNPKNRNMNMRTVSSYARQMKNGSWQMNGESIKLDENNQLIDGQHRMSAVVKAGIPVDMMVTFGIPTDAIKTIDTGKPRSNADHLRIHGFNGDLNVIAAAIRIINDFTDGKYQEKHEKLTPTEVIEFCEKHSGVFHSLERVPTGDKFLPRSIAVGLHYVFSKHNAARAEEFFAQLSSGANLSPKSPVLALRARLIGVQAESKRARVNRRMYVSYAVAAFNSYCQRRELSHLQYRHESEIIIGE